MKRNIYLALLLLAGIFVSSCDRKEDHDHDNLGVSEFDYRININAPTQGIHILQDSMLLYIDFISDKNAVVHHVNVRIYNKSTGEEIYNAPEEAHVHESSGLFSWRDDLFLSEENGLSPDNVYVVEAKVWGHSAGLEEVVSLIEINIQE